MEIKSHPCFNEEARHANARIHLPVAPACNIQCNFCNRQYDCLNESRPGVTSRVITPEESIRYLERAMLKQENISVVGIAGPGDPFANPEETMETLRAVRKKYPEMLLCVATNGLNILPHVDELAYLKVSHVTLTVNAVDPEIGSKIYSWVRPNRKISRGVEGAALLLEKQLSAIRALKERGVIVKVNSIILPGVNDMHIMSIAKQLSVLNVDLMNCVPLLPNKNTAFSEIGEPAANIVANIRIAAGQFVTQMSHCTRCRADAVGMLGHDLTPGQTAKLIDNSILPFKDDREKPHIAVASMEGVLINRHLGDAPHLLVYARYGERIRMIDRRKTPPPGGGSNRWEALAEMLKDCRAVLVGDAGDRPIEILARSGIQVHRMEGMIDEALRTIFEGRRFNHLIKRQSNSCGGGCSSRQAGCA